jgi:hypothetical protein
MQAQTLPSPCFPHVSSTRLSWIGSEACVAGSRTCSRQSRTTFCPREGQTTCGFPRSDTGLSPKCSRSESSFHGLRATPGAETGCLRWLAAAAGNQTAVSQNPSWNARTSRVARLTEAKGKEAARSLLPSLAADAKKPTLSPIAPPDDTPRSAPSSPDSRTDPSNQLYGGAHNPFWPACAVRPGSLMLNAQSAPSLPVLRRGSGGMPVRAHLLPSRVARTL